MVKQQRLRACTLGPACPVKDGNEIPHCKRVSVVTELSNISLPMILMLRNKFVITRCLF